MRRRRGEVASQPSRLKLKSRVAKRVSLSLTSSPIRGWRTEKERRRGAPGNCLRLEQHPRRGDDGDEDDCRTGRLRDEMMDDGPGRKEDSPSGLI